VTGTVSKRKGRRYIVIILARIFGNSRNGLIIVNVNCANFRRKGVGEWRKYLQLVVILVWKDFGGTFELDHAQLILIPDVQMSFGSGVFWHAKVAPNMLKNLSS
jgi:hypothetical protein